MFETILIILSLLTISALVIYFIYGISKDIREHEKYINSIQVGDVFEINNISTLIENPFEQDKIFEYTFAQCVITDIKEDNNRTKWVKYKCLKSHEEQTCQLGLFIEDFTRIKKFDEIK